MDESGDFIHAKEFLLTLSNADDDRHAEFLCRRNDRIKLIAISRRREFLADADGALLTRYPDGLESALRKLGSYEAPMLRASTTTAHLFISNPFGAHPAGQYIQKLFSTHPPIEERIAALKGMNV